MIGRRSPGAGAVAGTGTSGVGCIGEIAAAGFANARLLAWIAALFEIALAVAFLTGLFFSDAAIMAAAYVLFLAILLIKPEGLLGRRSS